MRCEACWCPACLLLFHTPSRPAAQVRIGGYELGGGGYEQRRAVALALPLAFNAATTNHDAALVLLDRPSMQRPIRLAAGAQAPRSWAGWPGARRRRPAWALAQLEGRKAAAGPTSAVDAASPRPFSLPPPAPHTAARPDPKWAMQQGTVLWVLGWGRLRWGGPQPRYLQEVGGRGVGDECVWRGDVHGGRGCVEPQDCVLSHWSPLARRTFRLRLPPPPPPVTAAGLAQLPVAQDVRAIPACPGLAAQQDDLRG